MEAAILRIVVMKQIGKVKPIKRAKDSSQLVAINSNSAIYFVFHDRTAEMVLIPSR